MPLSLAIHGGAGLIRRESLSPEREAACRAGLRAALPEPRQVGRHNLVPRGPQALGHRVPEAVVHRKRVQQDDVRHHAPPVPMPLMMSPVMVNSTSPSWMKGASPGASARSSSPARDMSARPSGPA